jgi:hypothetical protein
MVIIGWDGKLVEVQDERSVYLMGIPSLTHLAQPLPSLQVLFLQLWDLTLVIQVI